MVASIHEKGKDKEEVDVELANDEGYGLELMKDSVQLISSVN